MNSMHHTIFVVECDKNVQHWCAGDMWAIAPIYSRKTSPGWTYRVFQDNEKEGRQEWYIKVPYYTLACDKEDKHTDISQKTLVGFKHTEQNYTSFNSLIFYY